MAGEGSDFEEIGDGWAWDWIESAFALARTANAAGEKGAVSSTCFSGSLESARTKAFEASAFVEFRAVTTAAGCFGASAD